MNNKHSRLDLFGTEGRFGRAVYFLFSFIIPAAIFWIISAITGQLHKHDIISDKTVYIFILFAAIVALLMLIRLTIQRSHDFDKSGWLTILLILFPPAIIFFWLIPGSKGINSYGLPAEPLPSSMKFISPLIFLGLLIPSIYLVQQHLDIPAAIGWLQQLV